jgi:hypothetical protein
MELGDLMAKLKLDLTKIIDVKIREGKLEDAFLSVLGDKKIGQKNG